MEKIERIISTAVPLLIDDIDTDQIIPARFLKAVSAAGLGEQLFRDWRYNADGTVNGSCILNNKIFGGKIIISGKNFGCGSSREHAAWALHQYGFRAVIAASFADIFRTNALNNGIIPVELDEASVRIICEEIIKHPETKIEIALHEQEIKIPEIKFRKTFPIDTYKKTCLINGYDDLDYLLSIKNEIEMFESNSK